MKYLLIIFLTVQITAQSFKDQCFSYLQKTYPEYEKIELLSEPDLSNVENIFIDQMRKLTLSRGIAFIPVKITRGNKISSSIISLKVQLFKKVLIALKDIDKKEALGKSMFEEQVMETTRSNGNPIPANFNFEECRTKSFVKKGEILLEEKIEKIPLINSGDKVFAEVRNGNVIVTTEAYARQQGGFGDTIELVSSGNKIIKARIIDATKVIVE
jgi:flagella basal body P-ring formation protein FlgA